jgi:hypothetical protein
MQKLLNPIELRILILSLVVTLLATWGMVVAAERNNTDMTTLTGDARGYMLLAENITSYHMFSMAKEEPFYPESFRAPGYPGFLAMLFAIFGNWTLILFAQAALVSVAPLLLYKLFSPYYERPAYWGSIIFIFEPIRLFLSASLLSDPFFVCVFLGSLVLLDTARRKGESDFIVLSGVALGLAILVRPIAMFLPLLYAVYLQYMIRPWKHGLRASVTLLCVVAVCVGPWMYRNYTYFGSWGISSVGSANLMLYNAPEFLKYHPDERGERFLRAFRTQQDSLPREDALSLARTPVFNWAFREVIRGHEVSYAVFHVVKTIPFFLTDGLRDTVRLFGVEVGNIPNISTTLMKGDVKQIVGYLTRGGLPITLLLLGSGFWALVCGLYAYASVRLLLVRKWGLVISMTCLVCYFALLTGPVSNARYRVPVEGFLLVIALIPFYRNHYAK